MGETLSDMLYNMTDVRQQESEAYKKIEEALEHYEAIMLAVERDSLARDGMEMIESVMRGD